MGFKIGLDLGSTAIKMVLVQNEAIEWSRLVATAPGQEALALDLVKGALDERGLAEGDIDHIVATGYGKKLMSQAGQTVDEISANASGLFHLSQGRCRTIINIGGQDLKVINLTDNGKVSDFKMNDKCAAGTGRFFEQAARILDTPLESFGEMAKMAVDPIELNSTCVVFAESEIVSLLAKGVPKESVIKGLHHSVARRVANLLGRHKAMGDGDVYLDGGPSQNAGLLEALEDELLMEVKVLPNPQYTVAFGAAISAAR
ncbi:MAG: acyl-CoA dehydratase activase [Deltaproteobacteria bacterium]|jgi:predicted CoA-substrate-specific enzyme activase|nr:acyl-CoA dehydratase activase [Deltaproteobacteria bacterium]